MTHLLNICIPTYNRSRELSELYRSFLRPVLEAHPGVVQVHVFDNSDDQHAEQNHQIQQVGFHYWRNATNVGFSGNIINCMQAPSAAYTWIISDNDEPLIAEFADLLAAVQRAQTASLDALFLPFRSVMAGEVQDVRNTAASNQCPDTGMFSDYAKSLQFMPFVLFSAVILKTDSKPIQDITQRIAQSFKGNDYIQIPLYWSVIGSRGSYSFHDRPVMNYQEEFQSRFNFAKLVTAMEEVIDWAPLDKRHKTELKCKHLREWCMWLLKHRAGKLRVTNPVALYLQLATNPYSYRRPRNIVGLILPLFPGKLTARLISPH
jgi:glycosyltransferase involved in cell wall biosynthesis